MFGSDRTSLAMNHLYALAIGSRAEPGPWELPLALCHHQISRADVPRLQCRFVNPERIETQWLGFPAFVAHRLCSRPVSRFQSVLLQTLPGTEKAAAMKAEKYDFQRFAADTTERSM
jgi:hypothetical protein